MGTNQNRKSYEFNNDEVNELISALLFRHQDLNSHDGRYEHEREKISHLMKRIRDEARAQEVR